MQHVACQDTRLADALPAVLQPLLAELVESEQAGIRMKLAPAQVAAQLARPVERQVREDMNVDTLRYLAWPSH